MHSIQTALLLNNESKKAVVEIAERDMIPQTILVRTALLRAGREDPALQVAKKLMEKGWRADQITLGNVNENNVQLLLPWDLSEQFAILSALDNVTKAELYRGALFRYGGPELAEIMRTGYRERIEEVMGAENAQIFDEVLEAAKAAKSIPQIRFTEVLSRLLADLQGTATPEEVEPDAGE